MAEEEGQGVTFVDLGYPIFDCEMRICDQENHDLGENKIGYIQIRGDFVTSGYYHNETATQKAISFEGWLSTGDLGFMRNGRLIVTGRAKDVIFASGQNYYAHDIERVAEAVEGIELGKVAAVGVFNEQVQSDQLVLFVLSKQKTTEFLPLIAKLKRVISGQIGIEVAEVIPIRSIPKPPAGRSSVSSFGKITLKVIMI